MIPASVAIVLAQAQPPAPGSDRGEEFGKTSPIALVVILLLGVATVLLIRSMNKRLRNVPESFDPPEQDAEPEAEEPEAKDEPTTSGAAGSEKGERASPDG
ncbi:hypothetical protein LQ327_12795 [Actinomycetospora endophytica]|uniref:Secreted protein n=1 Tax=Actinomycetospora endophytica TaxID=2291215 RepID=A0ABS8P7M8_9PSEU|nr:hypothetical protein [Actinomycetospora endophytica]MCD2194253.1 hypothetical protein [Actinomycetospora endophytica]